MRRHGFLLALVLLSAMLSSCSHGAQTCSAPGDCPAGTACHAGLCEAVVAPTRDSGLARDVDPGLYDAAARHDARPDMGSAADLGVATDAGGSGPADPRDGGTAPDLPQMTMDIPFLGDLSLGDPCTVPDLELGELDACSTEDPNLFCLASLDGRTAYCSVGCADVEQPHHIGQDVAPHVHPNPCGSGCCIRAVREAGPGEGQDWHCRFGIDCR